VEKNGVEVDAEKSRLSWMNSGWIWTWGAAGGGGEEEGLGGMEEEGEVIVVVK